MNSASDWGYAAKQFVKMLPDKVIVHCKFVEISCFLFTELVTMYLCLAVYMWVYMYCILIMC